MWIQFAGRIELAEDHDSVLALQLSPVVINRDGLLAVSFATAGGDE
jgi:hypothetical protein